MARNAQEVTDAELGVLQVLWGEQRATIRQITDRLYPAGGVSQYATVQKLLERLENKGFVKRDRSQPVHVFYPAVNRQELIGRKVRAVAEKLCDGSIASLLTHLVRAQSLSSAERQSLRELVARLDEENGGNHRKA